MPGTSTQSIGKHPTVFWQPLCAHASTYEPVKAMTALPAAPWVIGHGYAAASLEIVVLRLAAASEALFTWPHILSNRGPTSTPRDSTPIVPFWIDEAKDACRAFPTVKMGQAQRWPSTHIFDFPRWMVLSKVSKEQVPCWMKSGWYGL
jgi:hypothetical protein